MLATLSEDGSKSRHVARCSEDFVLNRFRDDLFIGRRSHVQVRGHFRGLIDEVRISGEIVMPEELLAPLGSVASPP